LVPPDRRNNEYCKSLRGNGPKFKGKTVQQCIAVVDACSTLDDLIAAMNEGTRYWTWNFMNLIQGSKMTIEFRQPPGVVGAEGCLAWAEFTVTFCEAAIKTADSYHTLSAYTDDVGGLKSFCCHTRRVLATHCFPDHCRSSYPTVQQESRCFVVDTGTCGSANMKGWRLRSRC